MNISTIKKKLSSYRGKKLVQFSMFLAISFIFWLALTLNEDFRYDINYPVSVKNVPDSITLISEMPSSVKVSVKAKGYYYLKHQLQTIPTIEIDFAKYRSRNSVLIGNVEMQELVRDMFGSNSQTLSFSPDSINLYFTNRPGKSVKLNINAETSSDNQYIINGSITTDTETLMLYSINDIPTDIVEVETMPIKIDGLKNTTTINVKVKVPQKGMRVIPDSVSVTIPVEQLISKKRIANIEVINSPDDRRLITFPSQVEINYLVPKSLFNNETKYIKAVVDYKDIYQNDNKLPVKLIDIPSNYRGATTLTDSVEYVIEQ